jgi:lipid II:glycine glycyltransferase (peptidoglycan interpeptide bridge formation enzyme)
MVKEIYESREISKLFIAIIDDKIAVGLLLLIHNIPLAWIAGLISEFWKFMSNNLIHWEAIKWSMKKEYHFYDFGSARREKHGPTEFKRKFGGEYKENHVYSINLKPFKSKIIDKMI